MDLEECFPPDILQNHFFIRDFQRELMNLKKNKVVHIAETLCQTPLVLTQGNVKRIAFNIFHVASIKPKLIPLLVDICNILIQHQSSENALGYLKECIAPNNIAKQRWYRSFLINCITKEIITIDEFMFLLKSLAICESLFLLFCWFAPLIQTHDEEVYNQIFQLLVNYCAHEEEAKRPLPPDFAFFKANFCRLSEKNWELHESYFKFGYPMPSVAYFIKEDNPTKMHNLLSATDQYDTIDRKMSKYEMSYDVNQRIEDSLFEKSEFIRARPTLIQFAAFFGARKCYTFLLSKGAEISIPDDEGKTLPQFIIAGGYFRVVKHGENPPPSPKLFDLRIDDIIQVGPKTVIPDFQEEELHEEEKYLRVDPEEYLRIIKTAIQFNQFELYEQLINIANCDITILNPHRISILHLAASTNNIEILLNCLEHGIDINVRDNQGRTPLHYAAENGQCESLFALISANEININAQDIDGVAPIHLAAKNNKLDVIQILQTNSDLDLDITDSKSNNAVIYAIKNGNKDVVYYLLSLHIDVNKRNKLGLAPIHYAIKVKQYEIVSLLLTHNFLDINYQDDISMVIFLFIKVFYYSIFIGLHFILPHFMIYLK